MPGEAAAYGLALQSWSDAPVNGSRARDVVMARHAGEGKKESKRSLRASDTNGKEEETGNGQGLADGVEQRSGL